MLVNILYRINRNDTNLPSHCNAQPRVLSIKTWELEKETDMTGSCAPRRCEIAIGVGSWDSRYKKLVIICWRCVWRLSAMETKVDGCHAVGIDQNHAGVSLLEGVCQSQRWVIDGNPQTWRQED